MKEEIIEKVDKETSTETMKEEVIEDTPMKKEETVPTGWKEIQESKMDPNGWKMSKEEKVPVGRKMDQ